MNDFDYFAVPALSASLAKKLAISAAHGREFMLNPPKQTPAMAFGTAVHAAILEPHRQDVFVVRPDDLDRRTKDGKARYAELEATGMAIITQAEADAVQRIRDNVLAIPFLRHSIEIGQKEVPAFWQARGTDCKAKADLVCGDIIIDIKTTDDASPRAFLNAVYKWSYALQAVHYLDGFDGADFIFVAVEKEPPHNVGLYRLTPDMLQIGERMMDVAAARYRHGIETGQWPGFTTEIIEIGKNEL